MSDGERALGVRKADDQCHHVDPGAHIVTYPVGVRVLNVVAFLTDENDWLGLDRGTRIPGRREDVMCALEGWGPAARGLAALLSAGGTAGLGRLRHARISRAVLRARQGVHSRRRGAGAGFSFEDALVLATALEEGQETPNGAQGGKESKLEAIGAAF